MGEFNENEMRVAGHYDQAAFEAELARLPQDGPVEMEITLRWLARVIRAGDVVVEIGVGGGHYTEFLARAGCRLHLVDISARLLDAVAEKLRRAQLEDRIAGRHHLSATNLHDVPAGSADFVLLMGPLYHLPSPAERRRCVQEAARILKKGGTLFAAGINRLAYLRDLLRLKFGRPSERVAFHEQYLRDGNLDPEHAPPIGHAHLTTAGEFRGLFEGLFHEMALVGVESFTSPFQDLFQELPVPEKQSWLNLVEQTGQTPEGIGQSDHFLFVGGKLVPPSTQAYPNDDSCEGI